MSWSLFKSDATIAKEAAEAYPNKAEVFRRDAARAFANPNGVYMRECKSEYKFETEEELYIAKMVEWYKEYSKAKYNRTGNALKQDDAIAKKILEQDDAANESKLMKEVMDKTITQQVASTPVPDEAASLQPTVAQSAKVYDMSSYTRRATSLIESESANNNAVREKLEKLRQGVSQRAQDRAREENKKYVQEKRASQGDNTTINSTVPVAQEQTPETVENDDALEETAPLTVEEAYIALKTMTLNPGEAEAAYASLMEGDPSVVEQIIHDHEAYAQAEAQYLAELDATKQVSKELAKEAGKEFAKGTAEDIMSGDLDAKQLSKNFDFFMSNLGDSIGAYVGAALSGVPSPNDCSSQTMTNAGLGVAGVLGVINKAATITNGLVTFGTNLADAMADIYSHGPELLISMAETTAQTATQTTLMALRNAARTNCTIAMGMDIAEGTVAVGGAAIKAGISIAGKAKDLKGAADNLVKVVQKKNFMGDLQRRIKLHPAVREMNDFINGDKLDLDTYSRLTRNGDKFARVMLGVDAQNRYSSVKKHAVSVPRSRQKLLRNNYSTSAECNKWNLYSKQSYSLANLI